MTLAHLVKSKTRVSPTLATLIPRWRCAILAKPHHDGAPTFKKTPEAHTTEWPASQPSRPARPLLY